MPISILGLSQQREGATAAHALFFDTLEDIEIAKPFAGSVTFSLVDDDTVVAHTIVNGAIVSQCDRCLKNFTTPLKLDFYTEFGYEPQDDQWPIDRQAVDLTEPLRQEILFNLPAKALCSLECSGIHSD